MAKMTKKKVKAEVKETKAAKKVKNTKDTKLAKEAEEVVDPKETKEILPTLNPSSTMAKMTKKKDKAEVKETKAAKKVKNTKDTKLAKEAEDTKEVVEPKETKEIKPAKEINEDKEDVEELEKAKENPQLISEDAKMIEEMAQRLKFFFSDPNLRFDRFMKSQMNSNADKCVPIEKLLRFKSLSSISMDPDTLVKAVETSELIKNFLRLNENRDGIGRVIEFDVKTARDNIPYTIILRGLPFDSEGRRAFTVNDIKELLKGYGEFALIRLRFDKTNKQPKDSAFVEFEELEMAIKAISELIPPTAEDGKESSEPKIKLSFKDSPLTVESMADWLARKKLNKEEKTKGDENVGEKRKGQDEDSDDGAEEDSDEDKPVEEEVIAVKKEDGFDIVWKEGCVIRIEGLPEECDREAIQEAVQDEKKLLYYDYSKGQENGAIRFAEPSDKVKELANKLNNGEIKIKNQAVKSAKVLEGDEEKEYWQKVVEWKRKQRQQRSQSGGRDGRGGRGRGRGGGRRGGGRGGGRGNNKRARYH